jgi:carbon monoxide dehydrogenase subunit G
MPSAERTVTINRPAADVFAFIADGEKGTSWRPGVIDITKVSGDGVGSVYKQGVKGPMGRRIAADYEITACEPNRNLEFKAIAGPVRPTGGYRLAESDGSTHVKFWLREDLGGLKKLIFGRSVQSSMDAEMAALDKLKSVLEAPQS